MPTHFALVGCDDLAIRFVQSARRRDLHPVVHLDLTDDQIRQIGPVGRPLHSFDEVLEASDIDFVLLSGDPAERAGYVARLIRQEPIDLVFSPPLARKPDIYYELSLAQKESRLRVLPLLTDAFHPALRRLIELAPTDETGTIQWVECALPLRPTTETSPFLEGWSWLRSLAGEIAEVSASGDPETHVVVTAQSQHGVVSTSRWIRSDSPAVRFDVRAKHGSIECVLPNGFLGPATIRWAKEGVIQREETIETVIEEEWVTAWLANGPEPNPVPLLLATRQAELADAVERSLRTGRAASLTYDEFSDEAGFKGVMTTAGCGLVWLVILLAILFASGVPFVGYLILPLLLFFLFLQVFGLAARPSKRPNVDGPDETQGGKRGQR